ncbi:MAG: hypothetical protein WBG42_16695, partial [Cryomorphaceae bacterium]
MEKKFGIFTLAKGSQRFIDLAKNLAHSLDIWDPGIPRAVATDSNDPELHQLFDFIIPADFESPSGFSQKLYMYDYSPFEQTLFIDADSLVVAPLKELIKRMRVSSVSAQGFKRKKGNWAGVDISDAISKLPAEYLIIHNGGIYYFEKGKEAKRVFKDAKGVLERYEELGFYQLRGKIAHEPLMSSAMSMNQMNTYNDQEGMGMRTFVDINSALDISVILGYCRFREKGDPENKVISPCIVHFSGNHADWFHYKRETTKMYIHRKTKINPK